MSVRNPLGGSRECGSSRALEDTRSCLSGGEEGSSEAEVSGESRETETGHMIIQFQFQL